jgi:hypothetical protein
MHKLRLKRRHQPSVYSRSDSPYAGDVRDLMSQKPFMWNGNNPVENSDPSGYDISVLLTAPDTAITGAIAAAALFGLQIFAPAVVQSQQLSLAAEKGADWAAGTEGVNAKLQNIATNLFRGGEEEVPGGTAGAIRNELRRRETTGGTFHLEKGANELRGLRNLLKSNTLTSGERTAAEAMYKDLRDAFGNDNPDQFIRNNRPPAQATTNNTP